MILKRILLFTSFIILLFFVANSQITEKIRINPDIAMGGRISDFFSEVTFIPLQREAKNKQSELGFVYQFDVNENYFFFYDRRADRILVFKKNGEFYSRISPKSIGQFVSFFSLDRKKELIYILIDKKYIGIFDFEGNIVKKIDLLIKKEHNIESLFFFNKNKLVINVSRPIDNTTKANIYYRILFLKDFNTIYKKELPYHSIFGIQEDGGSLRTYFTKTDEKETVFFSPPNEYNIHEISDTGIINQYNIVLPVQYSVPNNFSTDSSYSGKRNTYFDDPDNKKKIKRLSSVFRSKGWLFFALETQSLNERKQYMYHLKTGKLIGIDKIAPDSISANLPITSPLGEIIGAEGDYIYMIAYSIFFHQYQQHLKDMSTIPQHLKDYFSDRKNMQSNPVVIRLKIK